jgi:hypothetical protein
MNILQQGAQIRQKHGSWPPMQNGLLCPNAPSESLLNYSHDLFMTQKQQLSPWLSSLSPPMFDICQLNSLGYACEHFYKAPTYGSPLGCWSLALAICELCLCDWACTQAQACRVAELSSGWVIQAEMGRLSFERVQCRSCLKDEAILPRRHGSTWWKTVGTWCKLLDEQRHLNCDMQVTNSNVTQTLATQASSTKYSATKIT